MSYTTPRTYVAGEVHTAAHHNTYERDNIAWLATDSPACRAYNSANISHTTSGSWQAVTMNSERFDNAAVHSTSSNTDRLTIPTSSGGKYIAGCGLQFTGNATGIRGAALGVNGLTTFAQFDGRTNSGAGEAVTISVATVYAMSAADYFSFGGYQNSGGALNMLSATNTSPEAWCFYFRT